MNYLDVSAMAGMTLTKIDVVDAEMIFTADNGRTFKLYHDQDCCEDVRIDDIAGELTDLIGTPLLQSEEVSSEPPVRETDDYVPESETWTFYKFATIKGYVTVRWYGTSNGYYSESVTFAELT